MERSLRSRGPGGLYQVDPCQQFMENPYVNPETKRRISPGGPTYRDWLRRCGQPPGFPVAPFLEESVMPQSTRPIGGISPRAPQRKLTADVIVVVHGPSFNAIHLLPINNQTADLVGDLLEVQSGLLQIPKEKVLSLLSPYYEPDVKKLAGPFQYFINID